MVADQHRLADGEVRAKTTRGVRQNHGVDAGRARRPNRVHDVPQIVAFVGVDAADEHQNSVRPDTQRQHLAAVPLGAGWGEPGEFDHWDDSCRFADLRRGGRPPGAEYDRDVVCIDTGSLAQCTRGQLGGRCRILHRRQLSGALRSEILACMPIATASTCVEDAVEGRRGDLLELSHAIHAEPELAFAEHRSCAKTKALVAERGFEISGVAELDTAFRAVFGSGPLVVGICAEYDALPGIGHACGHNIIAASAVGTALALAEVADILGLTVVLLGTPAEELGGGKALMLDAGAFDDIAATVMLHPGPIDIAAARSLALSEVTVGYTGRESHAAVAPYLGINAADAVTVTQVAIGLLRQQLAPGQMVHGIVTDGGQASNVIPAHAELRYTMRATHSESLRELESRMAGCFAAGAVATGCEHVVTETAPAYAELTPDPWLAETIRAEMVRLGREPVPAELEPTLPLGSTDMGNVTQVMPGIHPIVGIDAGGASIHQPEFTAAAVSASADVAVVEGAIMLARTVVALAESDVERGRVLEQWQRRAS